MKFAKGSGMSTIARLRQISHLPLEMPLHCWIDLLLYISVLIQLHQMDLQSQFYLYLWSTNARLLPIVVRGVSLSSVSVGKLKAEKGVMKYFLCYSCAVVSDTLI